MNGPLKLKTPHDDLEVRFFIFLDLCWQGHL